MDPSRGPTVNTGGTSRETITTVWCSLLLATSGVSQHLDLMMLYSRTRAVEGQTLSSIQ